MFASCAGMLMCQRCLLALAFAVTVAVIARAEEIEEEQGVLVLNEANFDEALELVDNILVEFYAPWCGHCKQLAPEYAKAAKLLKDEKSPIKLAKVDADAHRSLGEKHGIRGYPTLKFFSKKVAKDFDGDRTAEGIAKWLRHQTREKVVQLKTKEEVEDFKAKSDAAIIAYFKEADSENEKILIDVAGQLMAAEIQIGAVTSKELLDLYKITDDKVIIYRKFEEPQVEFDALVWVREPLADWIDSHTLPLLRLFTRKLADRLFKGSIKSHCILFVSKSSEDYEKLTQTLTNVAKKYRLDVTFVVVDVDDEETDKMLGFFGLTKTAVPTIRLIDLVEPEKEMPKYKPDFTEITEENLDKFIKDYSEDALEISLNSEDLPTDWDKNPVKILVGSNFHAVTQNADGKDVLVEIYAPWCGHCKELEPIWQKLAEEFADNDMVIIAKMDGTANEVEGLKLKGYPTILLFKAGSRGKAFRYKGDRTLATLKFFLEAEDPKAEVMDLGDQSRKLKTPATKPTKGDEGDSKPKEEKAKSEDNVRKDDKKKSETKKSKADAEKDEAVEKINKVLDKAEKKAKAAGELEDDDDDDDDDSAESGKPPKLETDEDVKRMVESIREQVAQAYTRTQIEAMREKALDESQRPEDILEDLKKKDLKSQKDKKEKEPAKKPATKKKATDEL